MPTPLSTPTWSVGRVFAEISNVTLRDPTTALFDPVSASWHVWCTHVAGGGNQPGYRGVIWHWSLKAPFSDLLNATTSWVGEPALGTSGVAGSFDASGVFTPGAARECNPDGSACVWWLFFGGVANQSAAHTEAIGVARASSPFGPFERHPDNPVFSPADADSRWCGSDRAARVDEIKPSSVGGQKLLVVKSVCANFTALPVVYSPVDPTSWGPPYRPASPSGMPLFAAADTCEQRGFEEPTLYVGPDGWLTFLGHNHGNCGEAYKYAHFVSCTRGSLEGPWARLPLFGGAAAFEPLPIPLAGDGVFGGAIHQSAWIDFPEGRLTFMDTAWTWSNVSLCSNRSSGVPVRVAVRVDARGGG